MDVLKVKPTVIPLAQRLAHTYELSRIARLAAIEIVADSKRLMQRSKNLLAKKPPPAP